MTDGSEKQRVGVDLKAIYFALRKKLQITRFCIALPLNIAGFEWPKVDEIGPVAVDDSGEPESVPPGLRHVWDPHPGVSLSHPLAPDLQPSEAGHQHPDVR